MDTKDQNQPETPALGRQQIDFGAAKSAQPLKSNQSSTSSQPPATTQPTPVTSAKAAINALYAQQANQPQVAMVTSAREAVNAAAKQAGIQQTKSAANLHHGSIQRSMESTRTSASALLRRADDPKAKIDTRSSSLDPLAKVQPPSVPKRPEREIPIVRTSLKLGAAARPKPAPVVLPPNSRMAQVARPVSNTLHSAAPSGKLARLLRRNTIDAQIVSPGQVHAGRSAKALTSGQPSAPVQDEHALTVKIVPSTPETKSPAPARPKRKVSAARDPQMLAGARRNAKPRARKLSPKVQTAEALGMVTAHSPRFRTKPKNFSTNQPAALPSDNSYVMAEPPKLNLKKKASTPEDLGVVENYHVENPPQPIGDKAPTGSIKAQRVAAGHVAASPELPTIKADNISNYSFSKKKSEPDNNRYALGGESPFLRSVNVEKRPLSNSPQKFNPKVERAAVSSPAESAKSPVKGRKNHYAKKSAPAPRQELPTKPTVIVPSNRRSKAPLVFLILLTIILGAAVGAAAYLCFFQ